MASAFGIRRSAFEAWLAPRRRHALSHVSVGLERDRSLFCTIYDDGATEAVPLVD